MSCCASSSSKWDGPTAQRSLSLSQIRIIESSPRRPSKPRLMLRNVAHIITLEILCSATQIDQRFSVLFQIPDRSITTVYANFSFSGSGSWGVATWALITGHCDSTCSNCSFSDDPTGCIGCNSFFIQGSDSRCSQCYTGFQLVSNNGIDSCLKCQI